MAQRQRLTIQGSEILSVSHSNPVGRVSGVCRTWSGDLSSSIGPFRSSGTRSSDGVKMKRKCQHGAFLSLHRGHRRYSPNLGTGWVSQNWYFFLEASPSDLGTDTDDRSWIFCSCLLIASAGFRILGWSTSPAWMNIGMLRNDWTNSYSGWDTFLSMALYLSILVLHMWAQTSFNEKMIAIPSV